MTFARHPGDRAQVALGAGGAPSRAVERQRATGRVLQRGPRVRGRLIPHSERKIQYLLFHDLSIIGRGQHATVRVQRTEVHTGHARGARWDAGELRGGRREPARPRGGAAVAARGAARSLQREAAGPRRDIQRPVQRKPRESSTRT